MDEIDLKILDILKYNARISMRELGHMIAMSNTATTERVKKLEELGIIQGYSTEIDKVKLGNPVHVFMVLEFTYSAREKPEPFMRYIRENKNIVKAYPVYTGGMDYLLEIYCAHTKRLEQIVQDVVAFGFSSTYLAGEEVLSPFHRVEE